jgi:hypothetical protein
VLTDSSLSGARHCRVWLCGESWETSTVVGHANTTALLRTGDRVRVDAAGVVERSPESS